MKQEADLSAVITIGNQFVLKRDEYARSSVLVDMPDDHESLRGFKFESIKERHS